MHDINNNNSGEKYSLDFFGLSKSEVDRDLSEFYDHINNNASRRSAIERFWASVEDYIDTLYIIKFVRKLSNAEMDEFTGIRLFCKLYYKTDWHYITNDFDECSKMHQKLMNRLNGLKEKARNNTELYETKKYESFKEKIDPCFSDTTIKKSNAKDGREWFIRELYYLWSIEQMPPKHIGMVMGISENMLQKKMREAGLARTKSEGHLASSKAGLRDYDSSLKKGRRSYIKQMTEMGLIGSTPENLFRTTLESYMQDYIDINNYEIVVGLNSRSIVAPLEVDIPVIIISKNTGITYKIAIEIDGDNWHRSEPQQNNDVSKKQQLEMQNWELISIAYTSDDVNNPSHFTDKCCSACKRIAEMINNQAAMMV